MELNTLVCANLMEDIGSGHAALLIANYPIMALHTPLVSISSYPITAQHRWLKSPESAVALFYATDNLLSGVFFSCGSLFWLRRRLLSFFCVRLLAAWLFLPFSCFVLFSPRCAVPLGCFGDGCAFHLGWAVAVAFRPGVT